MNAGVYVIGIGPGHLEGMTAEAVHILQQCTHIVGYLSLIHISEPTRLLHTSRMPSSA